MRERERNGGVSGWEKDGDWKKRERDRKREGGVKQMCQNCIPIYNEYEHFVGMWYLNIIYFEIIR